MDHYLEVFVTVVEKQNFSRAAEELHMTQPAVSQYIQTLERNMGVKLLERTNKYVRLNKAGEIVYHHAREILGLYTKMNELIDDLTNKPSGPLAIGASYSFGEYVLPQLLAKLHKMYPLIKPAITIGNTSKIAELVLSHQLDVGIIEGELEEQKLVIEPFAIDTLSVVVSTTHRLAQVNGVVEGTDLEQETWIVRESGSGTREVAEELFRLCEINPQEKLEFGSTQIIKESVEAGLGISLLSDWVIQKELALGTLRVIKIKDVTITRQFSTVLYAPFQTKALQVFLQLLND